MAKQSLYVAIIFVMIAECIEWNEASPEDEHVQWSQPLNQHLLDIFYGTYPHDEHHFKRVKKEWNKQLPQYTRENTRRLAQHIHNLRLEYRNQWQNRPETEREQMEETLARVYRATNDGRPHHETRMLDELFRIHPEYMREFELLRTVVYRWYELYAPLGKEINAGDVDWTSQRMTNLLHIAKSVRREEGGMPDRIRERWLQMYRHLNVSAESLAEYARNVEEKYEYEPGMKGKLGAEQKYKSVFSSEADTMQEKKFISKGRRVKWTDRMNSDLMYIAKKVLQTKGNHLAAMKDRWDKMQRSFTHLSGMALLNHAKNLEFCGYKPQLSISQETKREYEALPPLPQEILSSKTERRRTRQLQIREGREPNQQHQEEREYLDLNLTPQEIAMIHQGTETNHTSHTGYVHYPVRTYYYGSSSHTPIDQGPSELLPDTPHPTQQFWHPGGSSSHTSIHQYPSDLQLDTPRPYQDFLDIGGSSSHTSIQQDQTGPLPDTQRPARRQRNQEGSSRYSRRESE